MINFIKLALISLVVAAAFPAIADECDDKVKDYIVGAETDAKIGARTWNLVRLRKQSRAGDECAQRLYTRAMEESTEYWITIGRNNGCIEGSTPKQGEGCSDEMFAKVQNEINYMRNVHVADGPQGPTMEALPCKICGDQPIEILSGPAQEGVQNFANISAHIHEQQAVAQGGSLPVDQNGEIRGATTSASVAPTLNACMQLVADGKLHKDDVKNSETKMDLWHNPARQCVWGLLKGIVKSPMDLLKSVWGALTHPIATLGAVKDLGVAFATDPAKTSMNILGSLVRDYTDVYDNFGCMNVSKQTEIICRSITQGAGDVVMTILGLKLAKTVGKVVGNATYVPRRYVGAAVGAATRPITAPIAAGAKWVGGKAVDAGRAAGATVAGGARAVGGAVASGARAAGNVAAAGGRAAVGGAKAAGGAIAGGARAAGRVARTGARAAVGEVKKAGDVIARQPVVQGTVRGARAAGGAVAAGGRAAAQMAGEIKDTAVVRAQQAGQAAGRARDATVAGARAAGTAVATGVQNTTTAVTGAATRVAEGTAAVAGRAQAGAVKVGQNIQHAARAGQVQGRIVRQWEGQLKAMSSPADARKLYTNQHRTLAGRRTRMEKRLADPQTPRAERGQIERDLISNNDELVSLERAYQNFNRTAPAARPATAP